MKHIKVLMIALLVSLVAIPCFAEVQAPNGVPKLIEYTGKLTKSNKSPYPKGVYTVNFSLWTDAACTQSIWAESQSVEISPATEKGSTGGSGYEAAFTVLLGSVNPIATLAFDQDYYLLITENTGGYSKIEKLTGAPYAMRSDFANYAETVYDSDTGQYTSLQNITINQAKDADTVDGKHHSDIAQEIDDNVTAHANLKTTHGIAGEIVGTTDDQVLTNKHISGGQIDSGKISNDRLNMGTGNSLDADTLDGVHYAAISTEILDKITVHEANWGHLTNTDKADLTDGGDTTLHYHASDRDLNNATGTLDISHLDTSQVQKRVTGTCEPGFSIRIVNDDGSVVCEQDTDTTLSQATVRAWTAFNNCYWNNITVNHENDNVWDEVTCPANCMVRGLRTTEGPAFFEQHQIYCCCQ